MLSFREVHNLFLKNSGFQKLFLVKLVSGAGSSLVPIAFAIETVRIEPRGWGMASILVVLWVGRFLGMLIYKQQGFRFAPVVTMMWAAIVMGLAQLGLLIWFLAFSESLVAMLVSSFIYGIAAAFFGPSQFVTIPLVTSEGDRTQANSLFSIIGDIYGIVGPLVGASLVIFIGFKFVLVFDALTFFIGACVLFTLSSAHNKNPAKTHKTPSKDIELSVNTVMRFPSWVKLGFFSWFFISLAIGFMGAAGPTLVITNHSAVDWALVATTMAFGSLLGSAISLSGITQKIAWPKIHLLCGLALGCQLSALGMTIDIWALSVAAFIGAASVTASGIRWDTFGQSYFSGKQLQTFASFDQFAGTLGIPTGMILFGLAGLTEFSSKITVLIGCLAFLFTIPVFLSAFKKTELVSNAKL